MKKIIKSIFALIIVFSLGIFPTSATEKKTQEKPVELTFEMAKNLALNNSEKLKIQEEITKGINKEYKYKKKYTFEIDPLSTEFLESNLIKNYSEMRTRDFKYLDKTEREKLLREKINNKNKTLELFVNLIDLENTKNLQKIELENARLNHKLTKSKFDSRIITKVEYNKALSTLVSAENNLKYTDNDIILARKKFKNHLGLKNDNFTLKLEEPNSIITPEKALIQAKENASLFKNLKEEIDDMNEDMKKIKQFSIGTGKYFDNVNDQEKKIKTAKEDYNENSKNKLNEFQNLEYEVLISANNILNDQINLKTLENNLNKTKLLYNAGLVRPIDINKIEVDIDNTKLSMIKNNLKIENLVSTYENSQIL